MTRLPWGLTLAAVLALLLVARCNGRARGAADARIAALTAQVEADRTLLAARAAQVTRDSSARVAAERAAVRARAAAAAAKARGDSLDQRVRIVDTVHVVVGADTVRLPPLVIRDIAALRATVLRQADALAADTAQIHRLEAELVSARAETAAARALAAHQGDRANAALQRAPWWRRLGGVVVTAGSSAGGAAIGAVIGGPAGAAIGAGAGALLGAISAP